MLPAIGQTSLMPSLASDPAAKDQQIREVASEFESVLVAAMLKEGLKSASQSGLDDEENSDSTYMDMTCEQLAYFIGRQGVLGIADQIAEGLQTPGQGEAHANA